MSNHSRRTFSPLFKLTPLSNEATRPLPRGGIQEITFHAQTGNPMKDKINLLALISPQSTYHSALVSLIDSADIIIEPVGDHQTTDQSGFLTRRGCVVVRGIVI